GGFVTLAPFTVARPIDLGTNTAGDLGLTQAELALISTPVLQVGIAFNTGGIVISQNIAPAAATLSLLTNGSIAETGIATIAVTSLAVRGLGAGGVNLPNANSIGPLAGATTPGQPFIVNDATSLVVATVNGIAGFGPGTACAGAPTPINGIPTGGPVCLTVSAANGTLTVNQAISAGANNVLFVADNM